MAKKNDDLGLEVVEVDPEFEDEAVSLGVPDDDKRLENLPVGTNNMVSAEDRVTPTSDALRSEFDGDRPRENPRPAPKVNYERSPKTGTLTAVVQPAE